MKKDTKKQLSKKEKTQQIHLINPHAAGIDIGVASIFVCVRSGEHQEVREYSTFTEDINSMAAWLKQCNISTVAMESTGVYWIPVYDILEEAGFEVLLVNAHHIKNVPGRKTDVKDCQWIQQLHSYGLLRGSFRPGKEILPLRAYTRHRSRLFKSASTQVQLMHKAFTQMNIQLNLVISDITGTTGMQIIKAIVLGERNPKILASYRTERCKKSEEEIAKALEGNFLAEHIFALKQSLEAYEFFHRQILECEKNIEDALHLLHKNLEECPVAEGVCEEKPEKSKKGRRKTECNRSPYYFDAASAAAKVLRVNLLDIPGLDANTIVKILSEIGTDMSKWKSAKHFASWLGLCPANKISGGKVLNSQTKRTKNKAAQALKLAANTLRESGTALGAFFRRIRARLGAPQAITAAAHKLAVILYHMLKEKKSFKELGEEHYEVRYKKRLIASLKKKAKDLGYNLVEAVV